MLTPVGEFFLLSVIVNSHCKLIKTHCNISVLVMVRADTRLLAIPI
jgi:hypothetical protein